MKIRNGFVSNSSSSSFVLIKSELTNAQLVALCNHVESAEKFNLEYADEADGWRLTDTGEELHCFTIMANFKFMDLLKALDVSTKAIKEWNED